MSGRTDAGGSRVDRKRRVTVTFDGAELPAYAGDTLASALLANGVRVVSHGVYSGRPRGIVGIAAEEPNAYVQVESGAGEPMRPATLIEAHDGLRASSLAGRGRLGVGADPSRYDHVHAHCDLLIVGGGLAASAAARAASGAARVIVCDAGPAPVVPDPGHGFPDDPDTRVLTRTTVVGAYDHGYHVAIERRTDHLADSPATAARQRLWHIRAKQTIYATGVVERPYAFPDDDRPGVMLSGAAAAYVRRYGVLPGELILVAGAHDEALRDAAELHDAGVRLAGVLDARPAVTGAAVDELTARGIEVRTGYAVCGTEAGDDGAVIAALIAPVDAAGRVTGTPGPVPCDVVAVSGGYDPALALWTQAGGTLTWSDDAVAYLPGDPTVRARVAGAARTGVVEPGRAAGDGRDAAVAALAALGRDPSGAHVSAGRPRPGTPPGRLFAVRTDDDGAARTYVDRHRDATLADVDRAVRNGLTEPEHVKRYTTIATGADQGHLSQTILLGVLSELTGRPLGTLAPTTQRPPYVPVSFALLAGRNRGDLSDPVRVTAMHPAHEAAGVPYEDVGQWKRPWYAPCHDETMDDAVRRECRAVREGVGMMDASTLGKIELQGRDVGAFLDRMYTNMFSTLKAGRVRYGVMCTPDGMVFDDGTTARLGEDRWLMSTTTGNAAAVLDHLEEWLFTEWPELDVRCTSVTDHWATVAIAGPRSRDVVAALAPELDVSAEAFGFMTIRDATVAGIPARVFRISFSGELAYEVNVPSWHGLALWEAVREAGAPYGITPYGTETMHVLRAEKGFPIVGQDTDGTVIPQDLGLSWAVSKKKTFVGKRSYARDDAARDDRKQLVGLRPEGGRVIAEGAQLVADPAVPKPVPMQGHVTSSYWSVPLDAPFALALLTRGSERHGERLYAVDGDDPVPVTVTGPVPYDPEGARRDG